MPITNWDKLQTISNKTRLRELCTTWIINIYKRFTCTQMFCKMSSWVPGDNKLNMHALNVNSIIKWAGCTFVKFKDFSFENFWINSKTWISHVICYFCYQYTQTPTDKLYVQWNKKTLINWFFLIPRTDSPLTV